MRATINGTPSVYLTPEPPAPIKPICDYFTDAVNLATEMATDALTFAEAEAAHYTDCPDCQDAFVNWRTANPTASDVEAETAHREAWETCPACVAEYTDWAESVEREAEFDALCDAHDADAHELASQGDGARHYIAGHDAVWQDGGQV